MYKLLVLASIASVVLSEAPNRYARVGFQRVEQAPYQPAGYRPAGQQFRLPERQQVPQTAYGPPQEYGPPTTEEEGTEMPTTTEYPATMSKIKKDKNNKLKSDKEQFDQQGVYYIYHPNGLLQKITYNTKADVKNMGYTAQLKYQDVEPIKDPIYTYDPQTLVLQQIKL